MKYITFIFILLTWLAFPGRIVAAEQDIVIFRATINSLKAIAQPENLSDKIDSIGYAAPVEAKLSGVEVLSGTMNEDEKYVTLHMSSWPLIEMLKGVFFIAKRSEGGDLLIKWWELAKNGQCVPEIVVQDLNIQTELLALYSSGKLECKRQQLL